MKNPKLNLLTEDWEYGVLPAQSINIIQEPRGYTSQVLGPDGDPLIYVQEYKPGFKLHD